MSNKAASDESFINDQLAEFADRVIEEQATEISVPDDSGILRHLQEVVLEIHQSISQESPDPQLAQRVQHNVIKVWRDETNQASFVDRIKRTFSPQDGWESNAQRQRRVAGQLALAAIIILAIMLPVIQSSGSLPGAATGDSGVVPLISILVIAGAVTAWYLWRGKK